MNLDILLPQENFKGMSYGEWAAEWNKWIHSHDPDTYDGGSVLYLRGNVDYKPAGIGGNSPRYADPKGIYDRTGSNCESIFEGTAVFVPVITTIFFIGDNYEGKILRNDMDLRLYVNKDTDDAQRMWAVIKRKGDKKVHRLVKNIEEYRFESPLFKLTIPRNSLLRARMELPVPPGVYDAIASGYFIMIKSLPKSNYRIVFGGAGMGSYITNSIYDIEVKGSVKKNRDISSSMLHSKYFTFNSR